MPAYLDRRLEELAPALGNCKEKPIQGAEEWLQLLFQHLILDRRLLEIQSPRFSAGLLSRCYFAISQHRGFELNGLSKSFQSRWGPLGSHVMCCESTELQPEHPVAHSGLSPAEEAWRPLVTHCR